MLTFLLPNLHFWEKRVALTGSSGDYSLLIYTSDDTLAPLAESVDSRCHYITGLEIARGLEPQTNPGGVPVEMTSPGNKVINSLM